VLIKQWEDIMKKLIFATSTLLSIGAAVAMNASEFEQLRQGTVRLRAHAALLMQQQTEGLAKTIYEKHIRGHSYDSRIWRDFYVAVILDGMGFYPSAEAVGLEAHGLSNHTIPEQKIILKELFEQRFDPFAAFLPIGLLSELRAYMKLIDTDEARAVFPGQAFDSVVRELNSLWSDCVSRCMSCGY
jgi:hypothetical protein